MAGKPQKYHGKYYSRIFKPIGNGKYQQIRFPLNTDNKRIADSRWYEVKKYEAQIKEYGNSCKLSWQSETGKTELVEYTITEAVSDYIGFKQSEGLKDLTIERVEIAINHLVAITGDKLPVNELSISHIDLFKQHYKNVHVANTININLDKIVTFFKWLYVRGKISVQIPITKLRVAKPLPKYISDSEWRQIMELEKVFRKNSGYYDQFNDHWKRAFYFYRETGCRLIEPFIGNLDGNWLIVNANKSKTGVPREIFIDDALVEIYNEMIRRFNNSKCKNPRSFSQSYSRKFKYACETIGINKHFHCLRHTFAVRKYLQTDNIYEVMDDLGHSSVKTTEIYMKFDKRKLMQDFPSILTFSKTHNKTDNRIESYTNHRTQISSSLSTVVGRG
ncbi:tyrosine-type recombinase/integrase [Candidatus Neomarinimicrobiota bacterium]